MSTNKTSNFGLNQWEPGDRVLREAFNADNLNIDTALAGLARADLRTISGVYTGTGTRTAIHYTVGARPKLLVIGSENNYGNSNTRGLIVLENGVWLGFRDINNPHIGFKASPVTLTDTGFQVDNSISSITNDHPAMNREGYEYRWWALCTGPNPLN